MPRALFRSDRASAIVIVLMVVVLFSALTLAFFAKVELQRQISYSSAGLARADILAHMGLETVKGDLLEEIRAGSTTSTSNNVSIYLPITNYAMTPQLVGHNGITNLVKISTATAPSWRSTNSLPFSFDGAIRSVAGNSTTNAARGGRLISLKRWLKPEMLGSTETNSMPAPDWIIVTREGPVTAANMPTLAQLSDRNPTNSQTAIGRYAYTIYDEGGLLDINIAGYPSTGSDLTAFEISRKGLLALADLKKIPNGASRLTQAQVDGLIAWRNAGSKPKYYSHLTSYGATNGFLLTKPGDQSFVSRQDLIRYAKINDLTNALPYLSTFTRAKTAPSWYPRYNASEIGGNNGTGGVFAYKNNSEQATSPNRNLLTFRDALGNQFIKTRFPLSRIGLFNDPISNADSILANFGLSKSGVKWIYDHGSADHILTLEEVKSASRPPDFFELLKAAILGGSVGHRITGTYLIPFSRATDAQYRDDHIFQIGVNILDQYDAGNIPTIVTFNGKDFSGSENLPYLTRMLSYVYEETAGTIKTWFQPELWRPYQDISAIASSVRDSTPSKIRLQAIGKVATEWSDGGQIRRGQPYIDLDTSPGGRIEFSTNLIPRGKPIALSPAQGATSSGPENIKSWAGNPIAAIFAGEVSYAPNPGTKDLWAYPYLETKVSFLLQVQYEDGSWHSYTGMENLKESNSGPIGGSARNGLDDDPNARPAGRMDRPYLYLGRADPRTDRFGASGGDTGSGYLPSSTIRPNYGPGFPYFAWLPNTPGLMVTENLGLLSDNKSSSAMRYTDPDGVLRPAAGAYTPASGGTDGYPLIANNEAARPIILNRPFQSVGELGYTYRDLPWKELDFFTQQSADAALLDIFSVYEEPSMVAGRVSINSARPEVLEAVLAGGNKKEIQSGSDLSSEVSGIASAIRSHIADHGALLNRSEIVTELSDDLTTVFVANDLKRNKTQRESVVRALADVTETRTWNLMIDLVAQSGRYASNATSLNDFILEGERRYWLHVAIDRFTGEIIDQRVEVVSE